MSVNAVIVHTYVLHSKEFEMVKDEFERLKPLFNKLIQ